MENLPGNPINPGLSAGQSGNSLDELKAENEVLKLKLELEFGMDVSYKSSLDPATENIWLTYLYNLEKHYKDARRIKVYERLGRPAFKRVGEVKSGEMESELDRLLSLMERNGIALDCSVDYDKAVIYRFIVEELFDVEIDDISIDGYVHHFIYEEFHPNHDYDLRRYADEFIEVLLRGKLEEFDSHRFADCVTFKGIEYDHSEIFAIIKSFQEAHHAFNVDRFQIQNVHFDLEEGGATVQAQIQYAAKGNKNRTHKGNAVINFILQYGYWYINGFKLPGFG